MIIKNNFDFLRLSFAIFVLISHSYVLSGNVECDFLCQITNNQIGLSTFGLKCFFIISGYLIYQSLERSSGVLDYFWKRLLRIMPGLFVVTLLTILLAPFVYDSDYGPYSENITVYIYFIRNILLNAQSNFIDGVFEHNPYGGVINGSLWTLSYEFYMYILLAILYFTSLIKGHINVVINSLIIVSIILYYLLYLNIFQFQINIMLFLEFLIFFMIGSSLALYKIQDQNIKWKNRILLISLSLIILSFFFGLFIFIKFLLMPILIILIGVRSTPIVSQVGSFIGDISYGVYIYAFPIQQTLIHFFNMNYLSLMLYSSLITVLLAYLSWHLIEKKALRFRNLLKNT